MDGDTSQDSTQLSDRTKHEPTVKALLMTLCEWGKLAVQHGGASSGGKKLSIAIMMSLKLKRHLKTKHLFLSLGSQKCEVLLLLNRA